jgi:hypothetical protein
LEATEAHEAELDEAAAELDEESSSHHPNQQLRKGSKVEVSSGLE